MTKNRGLVRKQGGLQAPRQDSLVTRLLDRPAWSLAVRGLASEELWRLVDHIGLADASEVLSLATTEQLVSLLDEALWKQDTPGEEASFDAAQFALWLEVMLEAGTGFVVQCLLEMSEDLLVWAIHQQVFVLDLDAIFMELSMSGDDEEEMLLEKALESSLYEEFGEYCVLARKHEAWDALMEVFTALDRDHHSFLHRLLERCCAISSDFSEREGGWYEVLTSDEMLESDVRAEREDKRASQGYVSPSMAKSFLRLVEVSSLASLLDPTQRDPVTTAYIRELAPVTQRGRGKVSARSVPSTEETMEPYEAARVLIRELEKEGVFEQSPRLLFEDPRRLGPSRPLAALASGKQEEKGLARIVDISSEELEDAAQDVFELRFTRALRGLRHSFPEIFMERAEELQYVSNVLLSGVAFQERAFRPVESVEAALSVCQLGLERLSLERTQDTAEEILRAYHLEQIFLVGWAILYEEVKEEAKPRRAQKKSPESPLHTAGWKGWLEAVKAHLRKGKP
ncbi:MAG: hypothetical protein H6728_16395 [Myxococcales bacterium]|nr:hypothetical protein [Myxococcales bacterium]